MGHYFLGQTVFCRQVHGGLPLPGDREGGRAPVLPLEPRGDVHRYGWCLSLFSLADTFHSAFSSVDASVLVTNL